MQGAMPDHGMVTLHGSISSELWEDNGVRPLRHGGLLPKSAKIPFVTAHA